MTIRNLLICSILLLGAGNVFSQMADGSVAPDFTATDINGNTYRLYDILKQGKTVVLDISATWCGPCWNYHTSGELEAFFHDYGPEGTNQAFVFLIEGDASTNLSDLMGTGTKTQGNWVEGTPYPIIDSRDIAEAYLINYFPTVYMICPDRKVREVAQQSADVLAVLMSDCPEPVGNTNARILQYSGFEGLFCETVRFQPVAEIQNFGIDTLTSMVTTLKLNGTAVQQIEWSGSMATFETAEIRFDSLALSTDTELEISVNAPNGITDEQPFDNQYIAPVQVAPNASSSVLTLLLQLDQFPFETYWEIRNDIGQLLYFDGNRKVLYPNDSDEGRFLTPGELKRYEIAIPSDGCYVFSIYDAANDGLAGNAFFRLETPDGTGIIEGGDFTSELKIPFGTSNTNGIGHNASILNLTPFPADFCNSYFYTPGVTVRNLGNTDMTDIIFGVSGMQKSYPDASWQGAIPPGGGTVIQLPGITVDSTDNITVSIRSVNGVPDTFDFKNSFTRKAFRRKTPVTSWIVDIQTDNKGYETYWDITDDSGAVLFKGGNPAVGASGGGGGIASPSDPGAYANNAHYVVNAALPGYGCYHLRVLDDGGNGMAGGIFGVPNPYIKIRNNQVGIIVQTTGLFESAFTANVEAGIASTGTETPDAMKVSVFPNPVHDVLTVVLPDPGHYQLRIIDSGSGQILRSVQADAVEGGYRMDIPAGDLTPGCKILSLQHEKGMMHARFMKF